MCDLVMKTTMLDIHLNDDNISDKLKLETFIWDVTTRVNSLLVSPPLVIQFPICSQDLEKCIIDMERERKEHSLMAKRMKELLVSRKSNVSGFSGIGLYEKSNCSIHVWPEKQFMTFDISNILDFNNKDVMNCLYNYFEIDKVSGLSVSRYHKKPQSVEILNNN